MNELLNQFNKVPLAIKAVILAVVLAGIVLGYVLIWRQPIRTDIESRRREVEGLKAKLLENQAIADNKARFQEEIQRLKESLKQAQSVLPSDADIRGLLRQLTSLAKKSGLDVLLFQPGDESPEGFYARIPISLKLRGSYHDLAVYIDKVGKMKRIINIIDLNLAGAEEKDNKVTLNIDCMATTFRFRRGAE
jgi:type IV pilus assembly protein PilO